MVGDRWSDLKAAAAIGATSVLVLTGYGRGDLEYIGPGQKLQPDHVAEDLPAAVAWIISRLAALTDAKRGSSGIRWTRGIGVFRPTFRPGTRPMPGSNACRLFRLVLIDYFVFLSRPYCSRATFSR